MTSTYHVLADQDASGQVDRQNFADEVLIGLSSRPKRLPSRFFYDDKGSELFRRIMGLQEYYPTQVEAEILRAHCDSIGDAMAQSAFDVVDLGAGDGLKTRVLLEHFLSRNLDCSYVPIDISQGAMATLVASMQERLPNMPINGLVADYTDGLRWLTRNRSDRHRLVLILGSNIGNFDRAHARGFLHRLWGALQDGDHVLLGFDLKKDIDVLLRAYNDAEGVTAAFNLNLLTRINRELGGQFDLERFRHYGTYDVFSGAMASYLVSREQQTVRVESLGTDFQFDAWEPVHTEYSYKYLRKDISELAEDTGFRIEAEFLDSRGWFVDGLWCVQKSGRVVSRPSARPGPSMTM